MKEHIKLMVEALINENTEEATIHFHNYMTGTIKNELGITEMAEEYEEEDEDKKEDKKEECEKDKEDDENYKDLSDVK